MAYLLELAPITKMIILFIIGMISREIVIAQSTTSGDLLAGTNIKISNHNISFDSLRIGYSSLTAPLTISNFTTGGALPPAGTILHAMQQGSLSNARVTLDDYSNTTRGSNFMGRKARNTAASPQAPQTGDVLAAFTADGWGVDSFHNRAVSGVVLRADSGTWSNTSSPSRIVLSTTPDGSTTQVDGLVLDRNSRLWLPKLKGGIIRTDTSGGAYVANITTSDITGALGYTPANSANTDSTTYQTKYRSDTTRLNTYTAIAGKQALGDSATYYTKYRSDTSRNNIYIAINSKQAALSAGTGISIVGNVVTNTLPDQTVSITAAGYGLIKSGTYPNFTLTYNTPSFNNAPSITLNSSSQISTTNNSRVSYTLSIAAVVSIGQGIAYLEISANNSTWITINSAGETSLALLNTKYYNLQGEVPAGYYRRIRTAVTGGGTITYMSGQEVTY